MSDATLFRKPIRETGVDIEYKGGDGHNVRLQITTAYRVSFDAEGNQLPGGYQDRLFREKLTSVGLVSGFGPFERRGDKIENNDGCENWEEIERSCRLGIIKAFERKADHGDKDTSLLVKAVRYYEESMHDIGRFRAIIDAAASVVFPRRFAEVIVADYGDGCMWSRSAAP